MKFKQTLLKLLVIFSISIPTGAFAQENSGFTVSTVGGTASSGSVSGYTQSELQDAITKGYGPLDAPLYQAAQDGTTDNSYTPGCHYVEIAKCNTLQKNEFLPIKTQQDLCGTTYSSYQLCTGAAAQGYGYTPADATLWNEALGGANNASCQLDYNGKTCDQLTFAEYTQLKILIANCGVYPTYATCKLAVAQGYGFTTADVTQWNDALSGADHAACQLQYPTNNCDQITKDNYTAVKAAITSCAPYPSFAICLAALNKGYGYGTADVTQWAKAQAGTDNAVCQILHPSKNCDEITKPQYTAAQVLISNCNVYSSYTVCQAAIGKGYSYAAADVTQWTTAQAGTDNAACQLLYPSNDCDEITKAEYSLVQAAVTNCANYATFASCQSAVGKGYGYSSADIAQWNTALAGGDNAVCQLQHSGSNCNQITKAQYTVVQGLVSNCSAYASFAICQAAVAQGYGYTAADVSQWTTATGGADNAVCQLQHSGSNCNQITKAQYTTIQASVAACGVYPSYSVCQDALAKGYTTVAADASIWATATGGTDDAACNLDYAGNDCDQITKTEYVALQTLIANCNAYSTYAICKDATALGYGLTAADATLRTTALGDSANNAACISIGSLGSSTSNACAQLTKTQYDSVATLAAANQAVLDAVGDSADADALTVAQLIASDVFTGFSGYSTGCSTAPSQADVTTNFARFQHFLKKATFSSSNANIAKQLCYATANHADLTWHQSAPTDYIIAANNSVTNNADWKKCGFWGKRTALSKTSTNAMKSAGRTIIYDVKSQDSTLNMTAPSISSDKGHAVLNYTLNGQAVVSSANMTLSVLARSSDGFIVASAPDRNVTVSAENKIQTSDAVYNVFERRASSSSYWLRDAIRNPGPACPAGYSLVSTTDSATLNTLKTVAIKHGTGEGTMPSGHRMERCANTFLECNAGFNACSNPAGSNWRMRLMIYGESNGQTCAATRKKANGGGFYSDTTGFPSGFSMYPPNGQCKDVDTGGNPRLANGCVGWCWVRALCKKDGSTHTVWQ